MSGDGAEIVTRCPHDGQDMEWHLHTEIGSNGQPRTNGDFIGCDWPSIGVDSILLGLRQVRQDIANDEAAARADGLEGIARAYGSAKSRLEGAIWGIELSARPRLLPPSDGRDA